MKALFNFILTCTIFLNGICAETNSSANRPAAETVRQTPESCEDELKAVRLDIKLWETMLEEEARRKRNSASCFPTFHNFCSADFFMFNMRMLYILSKIVIMEIGLKAKRKELDFTKIPPDLGAHIIISCFNAFSQIS